MRWLYENWIINSTFWTAVSAVGTILVSSVAVYISVVTAKNLKRQNAELKSNEIIYQIIEQLVLDNEINQLFLKIEKRQLKYQDKGGWNGDEANVDKLLTLLNLAQELYNRGRVFEEDFSLIEYQMTRATRYEEIVKYLEFLDNFSKQQGIKNNYQALVKIVRQKYE